MAEQILTVPEIEKFHETGYIVLEPGRIFSPEQLGLLQTECAKQFPTWESGFKQENKHSENRTEAGTPKNYISPFSEISRLKANTLYGKRSTIVAPKFDQVLVDAIENHRLLDVNRQLLGCAELSLHNSALACVYPGTTGEPGNFHVDKSGFTHDPLGAVKAGKFMLNSFIYLSDVDEETAPIRLLPGSSRRYLELNSLVAPYFRSSATRNNLAQFNFFDEFVPKDFQPPVKITGKAGTITIISDELLHSATTNFSNDKVRFTLAIWFSDRKDTTFQKDYASYAKDCKPFVRKFSDWQLPYRTYYQNSVHPFFILRRFIIRVLKGILRRILKRKKKQTTPYRTIPLLAPWNAQSIPATSGEIIYINHLRYSDQKAIEDLKQILADNTNIRNVYLTAPNADTFLNRYRKKDYVFFSKLPLYGYFIEESWPRFVVRFFSGIASSFATESACQSAIARTAADYFRNLSFLEEALRGKGIDESMVEKDIPIFRREAANLQKIAEKAGLRPHSVTADEQVAIDSTIGTEPGAWIILKASRI
jgi:hypothetical protein